MESGAGGLDQERLLSSYPGHVVRHGYGNVYGHGYGHIDGHVYGHVHGHVYGHLYEDVYGYVWRHLLKTCEQTCVQAIEAYPSRRMKDHVEASIQDEAHMCIYMCVDTCVDIYIDISTHMSVYMSTCV